MTAPRQRWHLRPPFSGSGGALWTVTLPADLHALTDVAGDSRRSRLRLFEGDRELGPGHAVHARIRSDGKGLYSFWQDSLYFSTDDGSDPNTNGRSYQVVLRDEETAQVRKEAPPAAWRAPDPPLRCAILGMGNRGLHLAGMLGEFAGVEVARIADVSPLRLEQARLRLGAADLSAETSWRAVVEDPAVDIVFVTLPDRLHREAAEAAFDAGKSVYLEKPVATNIPDALAILAAWRRSGRLLQVGYVLRQTPFYRAIRSVVRDGVLGPVRLVTTSEQLAVRHGASFMRRWHRQSDNSGGLIVHKCCHDLDVICWLLDSRPERVASFGGSATFARPAPAPFCSQCAERPGCAFADDGIHESRTPAEKADPTAYELDRCVFGDGKDIVDNQVVAFELSNGTRGTHQLAVQGRRNERRISLVGDAARLDGILEDGAFTVTFSDAERAPLKWSAEGADEGPHKGGDIRTIRQFLSACAGHGEHEMETPQQVIAGMVMAVSAEAARRQGVVVSPRESDFLA